MFLLGTDALSELEKPHPDPGLFFNRILSVDHGIAIKFGEIQATAGPLPSLHNSRDMARTGATILAPWKDRN